MAGAPAPLYAWGWCSPVRHILSREDNWQLKFTQICQAIRDIKSNRYSSDKINNRKMTITSTQLGSTSILDNHKLPGSYNYVMGEQDDICSQYKPLLIGPRTAILALKRIVKYRYSVQHQFLPQYPGRRHGPLLRLQFQEICYGGPLQSLQVTRGATVLSRTSCPH